MILRNLQIRNFRGFSSFETGFDPHFNAVVGTNGAGKTSLLRAIASGLNPLLGHLAGQWEQPSKEDVRHERESNKGSVRFEPQYPVQIGLKIEMEDEDIEWRVGPSSALESNHWWNPESEGASTAAQAIKIRSQAGAGAVLPLVAFYPAARAWKVPDAQDVNWQGIMTSKPQRLDGYVGCLQASASLSTLVSWISRQQLISLQEGKDTDAFRLVKQALIAVFPGAKNLSASVQESTVLLEFSDGPTLKLADLSDGQRSFFALFGDLALRAAQLNDVLGDSALTETSGIVLIDELDLHLHPKWQREIVGKLKTTFPKLQFIIATHSPQIIGELKPEEIIILAQGGRGDSPGQTFGMDSNFILREVMGADERDVAVKESFREIRALIEAEQYEEALGKIAGTRETLEGSDPELDRAEALVQRIQLIGE